MIILDLVHNLALLVALAVVYQVIEAWWRARRFMSQFFHGLLFGMVGVVSMMTPVHFMPGIIFDGRSIILSVGGLFGGPVVALISALMCGAYRLWLGGVGAPMGLGVIFASAGLGVAFHYWRRRAVRPMGLLELWGFGLLVHGVMLGLLLLLPGEARQAVWSQLGLAIVGVYPVATGLICRLFLDYEKQRRDRRALEESEDKFKCFFEHANVGKSITRPSGELQVNQAFCDLLGYSPAELQHQSWQAITHPEDREPTQRVIDSLHSSKQDSARLTKRFLHKNGSVVWADVSTALRRDPAGRPVCFMTTVIDITEHKQAEAALRFASRRLGFIARMADALIGSSTTADIAQRLAAQAQECFEVDACVIRILQENQLVLIGAQGVPPGQLAPHLPVFGLGQQILSTGKPLVIPDVRTHPLTRDLAPPASGTFSFFSYAGVPLTAGGNIVGILGIYTTGKPRLFTTLDVEHLQIVANHTAASLCNEQLFKTVQAQKTQLESVITERKRAEGALRESEMQLRLSLDTARMGTWDWDIRTGRVVWSSGHEALWGYAPGTFPGTYEGYESRLHPDDVEGARRAGQDALARRSKYEHEYRVCWPDGTVRWVVSLGQAFYGPDDQPARMIGVAMDITERKRTEEQLRKQAALLNTANDAIYVRAMDNTITFWNDGATRLYGWSRAEALGRKANDLAGVDTGAFAAAQTALLEQGHWSGELTKTSKAGKKLVVFCRWTLLRDEQGRPKEILAINTDITERKHLEASFLRAQRMEGIGALAGGIAHDLNNILAPILMVGPLLRETVSDPESLQLIDTVEACAQRGAAIIKQLLTFARGQPGTRAPLPARHLLNEMHHLICETFPRNIQPRVMVPKDLWPILGDATQIHQALMNLCVNARDALPEGGTLTLTAENVTLDEAAAAQTPEAKARQYVRLSVADTGTGIAPEHLERIFDPFFTTKPIGKGTGLGLATVLGIVRGHGGFVRVHSHVGQGTTFEIYLPATPEAKADRAPGRAPPPPRGQGELIMVVDDEASVREIVRQTLEKYGYRVLTAGEGAEALALFGLHRGEVRAVLTDMMMPGMDGPKLAHALRQLDAQLPVLGMTGLAERAGVEGLDMLNLPTLLIKPFSGETLLTAMHKGLARSRPAPEAGSGEAPRPQ